MQKIHISKESQIRNINKLYVQPPVYTPEDKYKRLHEELDKWLEEFAASIGVTRDILSTEIFPPTRAEEYPKIKLEEPEFDVYFDPIDKNLISEKTITIVKADYFPENVDEEEDD